MRLKRCSGSDFLLVVCCTLLIALLSGCEKRKTSLSKSSPNQNVNIVDLKREFPDAVASFPEMVEKGLSSTDSLLIPSPLEKAQKEYLAAYEKYVKTLRESGPQTLETLHALADYQKKYQLYQTLLEAQKVEK